MRCWFCDFEMGWESDFSFEDFCYEGDGVVAVLSCSNPKCEAIANFIKGECDK